VRAWLGAEEDFVLATGLGGSISGEKGVSWIGRGQLPRQRSADAPVFHDETMSAWDPRDVLLLGEKVK
jgi:hypothetical protein